MNHTMGATMQANEDGAVLDTAIRLRAILDAVYAADAAARAAAARYLADEGLLLPRAAPCISHARAAQMATVYGRPYAAGSRGDARGEDGNGW